MSKVLCDRKRIVSLDLLRGVLAFSVLFYHLLYYVHGILFYNIGLFSVYAFFVLSGYALHYVYAPRIKSDSSWLKEYLKARFFRIIPLLTLVTLLSAVWFGGKLWKIILNIFGLFGLGSPGSFTIAGGGWSLGIEIVFYLLFPVLFVLLDIIPIIAGLIFFLSSVAYINTSLTGGAEFVELWGVYISPLSFIFYFFSGMVLSRFREIFSYFKHQQMLSMFLFGVVVFFLLMMPSSSQIEILTREKGVLMMLLVILMVVFCSVIRIPSWFEKSSIYLGNISYGVYLWHSLILMILMDLSKLQGMELSLAVLSLTVVVSSISYFLFEKPIRVYGRSVGGGR